MKLLTIAVAVLSFIPAVAVAETNLVMLSWLIYGTPTANNPVVGPAQTIVGTFADEKLCEAAAKGATTIPPPAKGEALQIAYVCVTSK
jgi:hypothetical protein